MKYSIKSLMRVGKVIHHNHRGAGMVLLMPEKPIIKCFPSKGRVITWLRHLLGCTKAHKQMKAALTLQKLGVNTPQPLGVTPFVSGDPYEGAYLCAYIEGSISMATHLASSKPDERRSSLKELAAQIGIMVLAGVLFVDFHLDNILVDASKTFWWIDPELSYSRSYIRKRFWARMERMHRRCNPGVLTEEEWTFFCEELAKTSGLRRIL
jgi:tRNA A-37 threonylcarbamoyl transferase component Bud32